MIWGPLLPGSVLLQGAAAVTGTGAGTIAPTGSASGTHGVTGTAAGTVAPTADASGTHGVTGTAAGTLPAASGAASGTHGVTGTAAGTIAPSGAASGTHGVTGTAAGTVAPTGAASGTVGVTGTAAGAVLVTGSAVGTAGAAQPEVVTVSGGWIERPRKRPRAKRLPLKYVPLAPPRPPLVVGIGAGLVVVTAAGTGIALAESPEARRLRLVLADDAEVLEILAAIDRDAQADWSAEELEGYYHQQVRWAFRGGKRAA